MKKFFQFLQKNINRFLIGILFVLGIGIILLLLPTERKYRHEFQKGKPWLHEDLYAPFDFAIYKTNEEIIKEQDSVKSNFIPYFQYNENIYSKQKEKYINAFYAFVNVNSNSQTVALGDTTFKEYPVFILGIKLLKSIYSKGLIELPKDNGSIDRVNIIRNKLVEEVSIAQLNTISTAKIEMAKSLNSAYENSKDSIVFILQKQVPLRAFIKANIRFDKKYTHTQEDKMLATISSARGMVQEGEKIISKGDLVDEDSFRVLYSLKREFETSNVNTKEIYYIYIGQTILVLFAFFVLILLIYYAQPEILTNNKSSLFIVLVVVIFVALASLVRRFDLVSIYVVPFVVIPILVKTFFNQRIALFTHLVTMLIIAFMAPNSFEFVFIQIIVGVIAMFSIGDNYKRSYLFWTAVFTFITYSIVYLGIGVMQEGDIAAINWQQFIWFGWNSVLLLTVYPLIFVFERMFGYLSDLTLIELSDTNNALLRDLSEKAPGTFQHSLMVSNLAEYTVSKIGGKPLLAKVGALYHDIGKADKPTFFTENQLNIENPHNKLKPEESAKVIIDHVLKGERKARKAKLPQQIIDFIMTHHGTTNVEYFLYQYKKDNKGEDIDESLFRYPAYRPNTKELAVMMMADSIEAAARSLKEYNDETISQLVNSIINKIIDERQLDEVEITFKDLTILRQAFVDKLMSIYHARIAYPEEILKGR